MKQNVVVVNLFTLLTEKINVTKISYIYPSQNLFSL